MTGVNESKEECTEAVEAFEVLESGRLMRAAASDGILSRAKRSLRASAAGAEECGGWWVYCEGWEAEEEY